VSAVIGTAGLFLLGQPFTNSVGAWLAAVTVYGIGKTFYWPTMLGVISERYPKGGALALGITGGIGMLSAGLLGGPVIGYKQDYAATHRIQETAPQTYQRYRSAAPKAPLPFLEKIAGLDNGKVGDLLGEPGANNGNGQRIESDIEALKKSGRTLEQNEELKKRVEWWNEVKSHAAEDAKSIGDAQYHGGKTALTWTAAVPATMAVGYLLLLLYFALRGGYKQEVLVGHGAEDDKFTGGVEGPVR
jgi:hypothetical protein